MSASLERLRAGLHGLERENLARRRRVLDSPQGARVMVDGREVLNFSSNDYLGLAHHPRLRAAAHAAIDAFGTGAGASPLVSGHQRPHEEAEQAFARFCGAPRALLFGSGYAANLGILTALCDRHAQIFADRLNHACLNDGATLSRARFTRYGHLDLAALAARLAESDARVRVVATDSVFSMDGDLAPLPEMLALCERHDAWLVVDDAHAVGVLGKAGRGSLDHYRLASPRLIVMATLGKALGGYGAFVAGAPQAIEWLLQRARTYVYSTALPASAAAVARSAIEMLESDDSLVERLRGNIRRFRDGCGRAAIALPESISAIQPIIAGDAGEALRVSAALLERGFFVPAIRPPTVPQGSSRLRVSISAAHEPDAIDALVAALAQSLRA